MLYEGDLIYLHVLGRPIIVINSIKIAHELLGEKGVNFSDRPHMLVMGDM